MESEQKGNRFSFVCNPVASRDLQVLLIVFLDSNSFEKPLILVAVSVVSDIDPFHLRERPFFAFPRRRNLTLPTSTAFTSNTNWLSFVNFARLPSLVFRKGRCAVVLSSPAMQRMTFESIPDWPVSTVTRYFSSRMENRGIHACCSPNSLSAFAFDLRVTDFECDPGRLLSQQLPAKLKRTWMSIDGIHRTRTDILSGRI